jgi:hypothetical protein
MPMNTIRLVFCCILLTACLTSCGGNEPVVVPDREAFDAAVEEYLRLKSMDLAIREYEQFELGEEGATATAVIAMVYAGEGVASVQQKFRFSFQKTADRWQVTGHAKAR